MPPPTNYPGGSPDTRLRFCLIFSYFSHEGSAVDMQGLRKLELERKVAQWTPRISTRLGSSSGVYLHADFRTKKILRICMIYIRLIKISRFLQIAGFATKQCIIKHKCFCKVNFGNWIHNYFKLPQSSLI